MTNEPQPAPKRLTISAAVIIAAGLAAGVALARPGSSAPAGLPSTEPAAAAAVNQTTPDGTTGVAAPGYGQVVTPSVVTPSAATPPTATAITIQNFDFGAPASVAPGSVITVTNADTAPHTLTFTDGSIDTQTLRPGVSTAITAPTTPGTYTFFCAIHPTMTGQLTVTGA